MKKKLMLILIITISILSCNRESIKSEDQIRILSDSDPNNPNAFNGIMNPISTLPYSQISSKEYIIELDRWDIPNNRTNPEKTTDNIQKAIDWAISENYGTIRLPKGHYLVGKKQSEIYQSGIVLGSNMAFLLDKDAIIEMAPNNKWNYCAITIKSKSYVLISGGLLLGDRDNHVYTARTSDGSVSHDEGHLICIEGESDFVTVENMTIGKANGDGIILVGSEKGEEQKLKDIVIRNNHFSDNRRQGISLVGSSDVLITKNEIHHTKGVSPQFGIDIEGAGRLNKNITIRNNYFHNNSGGDIVNSDGENVLVEGNILKQGKDSKYIDGPLVYWKNADWTIRDNQITMLTPSVNNLNGIIMYSNDTPKKNPATTYIYNNTLNNCGMYMYKGADLVIKNNIMENGHLVFKEMKKLTLENNRVVHENECWAYRFLKVSGSAKGNKYNGGGYEVPLSNTPWNGCWVD